MHALICSGLHDVMINELYSMRVCHACMVWQARVIVSDSLGRSAARARVGS